MEATDGGNSVSPLHEKTPDRLFFADNLRTWLVTLVVLHHMAIFYAGGAALLLLFILINQGYFMGALFLVSGYFSPGSLEHKGPMLFVKDRLIRLGIPLLLYIFVLNPIASLGMQALPSLTGVTGGASTKNYFQMLKVGPMWFVEILLIFDIGYAALWWWTERRSEAPLHKNSSEPPKYRTIALFILFLALTSYLIRIFVPLGVYVLGFPTLSYLAQYLSFFIIGIIALRRDWFQTIPVSMGNRGFVLALVATLTLFPLALTGGSNFFGKGYWQSAAYALWDSAFAVGMALGLITLFRARFNYSGRFSRFLHHHSYTVYVIQVPLIVFVAILVSWIHLSVRDLFKWDLASIIVVPLCFVVAYLVRKIPFADRVF
jgi:glucan biosynthesis protein C